MAADQLDQASPDGEELHIVFEVAVIDGKRRDGVTPSLTGNGTTAN
jgi:hypothetical protein